VDGASAGGGSAQADGSSAGKQEAGNVQQQQQPGDAPAQVGQRRRKVPRIYFATRTHSQIAQVCSCNMRASWMPAQPDEYKVQHAGPRYAMHCANTVRTVMYFLL
jgi:hypothetical protein